MLMGQGLVMIKINPKCCEHDGIEYNILQLFLLMRTYATYRKFKVCEFSPSAEHTGCFSYKTRTSS